jgi:hypothetical protein
MSTLSKESGMAKNSVKKHIKILEEKGFLVRTVRWDKKTKKHKSNIYQVVTTLQGVGNEVTEGRANDDLGVGHQIATNQNQLEPNPINHSEPSSRNDKRDLKKIHHRSWTEEEKNTNRVQFIITAFTDLWKEKYKFPPAFTWEKHVKQVKEYCSDAKYSMTRVMLPYYFEHEKDFFVENKHPPNIFFSNDTFNKLAIELKEAKNPHILKAIHEYNRICQQSTGSTTEEPRGQDPCEDQFP